MTVDGELDFGNLERVRDALDDVRADGHRRVLLDLRDVRFIDCSATRFVLQALSQRDMDVAVVESASVRRMLEFARSQVTPLIA